MAVMGIRSAVGGSAPGQKTDSGLSVSPIALETNAFSGPGSWQQEENADG